MTAEHFTLCERHFRIFVKFVYWYGGSSLRISPPTFHNSRNIISAAEQCVHVGALALGLSFACLTKYILIKIVLFGASCRRGHSRCPCSGAEFETIGQPPRPPPVVLLPLETPLWRVQSVPSRPVPPRSAPIRTAPQPTTRWKSEIKA